MPSFRSQPDMVSPMTLYCRACGIANEIDASFCDQCGEPLRTLAPDADAAAPRPSAGIPPGNPGGSIQALRPAVGYGIGAFVLLALAIVGWLAFAKDTASFNDRGRIGSAPATASGPWAQPFAGLDLARWFSVGPPAGQGLSATATTVAFYRALGQGNTEDALALIHPAQRAPGTDGKIAVYLSTQNPNRAGEAAGPMTFKAVVERENDTSATVRITFEGSARGTQSEWLELLKHEGRWFVSLL